MRTTVTLDPDTVELLARRMRDRGQSLEQALNDAVRAALALPERRRPFQTETASMGESPVNADRALQLVADLEDDELMRRMRTGR